MALSGKLEADVEMKSAAEKLHNILTSRSHQISNMFPHKIQGCELLQGEWGEQAAVVIWRYTHEGVAKEAKTMIETVDDVNLSKTFKVIDGDVMKEYNNLTLKIQLLPKDEGSVHWTMEYEKLHEGIPSPDSTLNFLVEISKDIDERLVPA